MEENKTNDIVSADEIISIGKSERISKSLALSITVILSSMVLLAVIFSRDIATILVMDKSRIYSSSEISQIIETYTTQIRLAFSVIGVMTLGLITYFYTSGYFSGITLKSIKLSPEGNSDEISIKALAVMVESIQKAAEEIKKNRHITNEDHSVITGELKEIIKSSIPVEVFAAIDKKYGNSVKNEFVSQIMEEKLNLTKNRLALFQSDLSKKASAALSWGVSTAVIGIILLGIFIYNESHPQNTDNISTVFYYTMRISLVSMIEIIAFFFLRHYKSTLNDEKYVSNEITNIEIKILSAISALKMGNAATSSKIFIELSKTERNFSLKKGETSIFHSASGSDMLPTNVVSDILGKTASALKGGKN